MRAPVVIVGAGRSGTNLLAATFEKESPRFKNLYENRYIWTYGQRDRSVDTRSANEATELVASYIRRHFARQADETDTILVDKTPSNALRIPFVVAVFPDVKIVNIVRDGRDNIVSRARQWEQRLKSEAADFAPGRTFSGKSRIAVDRLRHLRRLYSRGNLPPDRLPAVVADYVPAVAAHLLTGRPRRYAERVPGLSHILKTQGLDVAAAVQWREVVMASVTDGRRRGQERYIELRYEELLFDPATTWSRLQAFLGVEESGRGATFLAKVLQPYEYAAWRQRPDAARIEALEAYMRPTLEYLGYEW